MGVRHDGRDAGVIDIAKPAGMIRPSRWPAQLGGRLRLRAAGVVGRDGASECHGTHASQSRSNGAHAWVGLVGCVLVLLMGCADGAPPDQSKRARDTSGPLQPIGARSSGPARAEPMVVDRLLLFPSTSAMDMSGRTRQMLPYRGGQLELIGARSPGCARAEPAAVDLELIGNGSRAEATARIAALRWGDRPVEVWALNWPGYGRSTAPATMSAIAPAALSAYDAVVRVAGGRPVVICAHSLGTAGALHVAAHRAVAGLVLLNPPPLRQLIVGHYGWWNLWLGALAVSSQVPGDLDSLANGAKCSAPALFVSSGRDTVVPPAYHRRVFDAYAEPKRLVVEPDADHNTSPDPATDPSYAAALDWLWEQMRR